MAVINLTGRDIPLQIGNHRAMFPVHVNDEGWLVVLEIRTELYDCEEVQFTFKSSEDEDGEGSEAIVPALVTRSQVALPMVGSQDIILVNETDLRSCRNMARVYAPHEGTAVLDNTGALICYTRLVSS